MDACGGLCWVGDLGCWVSVIFWCFVGELGLVGFMVGGLVIFVFVIVLWCDVVVEVCALMVAVRILCYAFGLFMCGVNMYVACLTLGLAFVAFSCRLVVLDFVLIWVLLCCDDSLNLLLLCVAFGGCYGLLRWFAIVWLYDCGVLFEFSGVLRL